MPNVREKYLITINNKKYIFEIININEFREPSMKYCVAVYKYDTNELYIETYYCGEDMFENATKYVEETKE